MTIDRISGVGGGGSIAVGGVYLAAISHPVSGSAVLLFGSTLLAVSSKMLVECLRISKICQALMSIMRDCAFFPLHLKSKMG